MTTTIPDMPAQQARAAAGEDPRGWLVFDGPLPAELARAEDSRAFADFDQRILKPRGFTRPATDTERMLLQHLGFELSAELLTVVSYRSKSCRNRRWPVLETQILEVAP